MQLHRLDDPSSSPTPLAAEYVGNKLSFSEIGSNSRYTTIRGKRRADRSMHGRVEVVVQLEYVGPHRIVLTDQRGASFPWAVELEGVCAPNETTLSTQQCACSRGFYRPAASADCTVCLAESYKPAAGDGSCTLCIAEDAQRRVTVGVEGEDHDSLSDCGCSVDWYLKLTSLTPAAVASLCPPYYNEQAWADGFIDPQLLQYRDVCCNGKCTNSSGRKCAQAKCKDDLLLPLILQAAELSNSSVCARCDPESTACNDHSILVHRLPLLPGFWRTNELSTAMWKCIEGACLGSDPLRLSVAEHVCAAGHSGPLCSVCLPQYYKLASGLCAVCGEVSQLFLWVYIAPAAASLLLLLTCCCATIATARKYTNAPKSRDRRRGVMEVCGAILVWWASVGRKAQLRLKGVLQGAVVGPKLKILVTMVQVQAGLVTAFSIALPDNLASLLRGLQIWQVTTGLV